MTAKIYMGDKQYSLRYMWSFSEFYRILAFIWPLHYIKQKAEFNFSEFTPSKNLQNNEKIGKMVTCTSENLW